MSRPRVALLLDGAFVVRRLTALSKRFPTPEEIAVLCAGFFQHEDFANYELYRLFFYDAEPWIGKLNRPVSGEEVFFSADQFNTEVELRRDIELMPNFTVRRGDVSFQGWALRGSVVNKLKKLQSPKISDNSFYPNFGQKGVDMRIGLDIAALVLKRLVQAVLILTSDADMVPAMRFARREGVRVYLNTLGVKTHPELKAHADVVLPYRKPPRENS